MKKVTLFLFAALIFSVATNNCIAQSKNSKTQSSTLNTVKNNGKIDKVESIRTKLAGYVTDAVVLDDGLLEAGETSEFGQCYGTSGTQTYSDGNICHYGGKDYRLVISYVRVENNGKGGIRILDFVLFGLKDNKVLELSEGYMCNVRRGDTPVCDEVSFVVVKDVGFDTDTPVIKAWKMDNKGKFADVNPAGLIWNASTP
ncbi:MAG: hypothetical protein LBL90_08400 [Prevotellaceae bacterium]|jgi:hypothetical protein|nr:hypothetical protein [Prevotellaceae bacterium]